MMKFLLATALFLAGFSQVQAKAVLDSTARWVDTGPRDTVEDKIWLESEATARVPDSAMIRIDAYIGIVYVGYIELKQQRWYDGDSLTSKSQWVKTGIFLYHDKKTEIPEERIWMHRLVAKNPKQ